MEILMEKEKNIMKMVYYYLKENLKIILNGMENYLIKIIILSMK